jgi:hypothetical protein
MHDRTTNEAPAESPAIAPAVAGAPILVGVAAASLGAGLVHAAAAGTHVGADTLVRLFAVTAAVQVAAAALVLLRPGRVVLAGAAVLNVGAAVAWAVSRWRGLPWPAELEAVEEVGTQDTIAAVLGAVAGLAALLALVRPRLRRPRPGPVQPFALTAGLAVLALAVPGMAAQHDHGPSHDHGHGGDEVAVADHEHTGGETVTHAHTEDPADPAAVGPIISLDDARVTEEQRAIAAELIETTGAAIAGYADVAAVQAAGYVSIGDSSTGFEHYVSPAYLGDDIELDPARVESIVYTVAPDGTRTLASGMFILGFGKTMADVPDVAGPLTTWHDHQNLCWEGVQVVGTTDATGSCERGVFRATPPMLHVWVVDNPCGPFAGLEGHGGDCGHSH